MILKDYQIRSLEALEDFLKWSTKESVTKAYKKTTEKWLNVEGEYNDDIFQDEKFRSVPYSCIRIPTGGGKTLTAANAVPLVFREYLGRDFGLVMWLAPSKTIVDQTYEKLNDKRHPFREVLDIAYGGAVNIMKIDDALNITKADMQSNINIIITTFAIGRIEETEKRRVYRSAGSLQHHFENLPKPVIEALDKSDAGNLNYSLINVISLYNPLIIVDEAHNARTKLMFDMLEKMNPSCIVEYTATPLTKGRERSNVIYRASAATLKEEDMIKMPIKLLTTNDWQATVNNAIEKQKELEKLADQEEKNTNEYIRPIVLIQAQNDSKTESTINVAEVVKFLKDVCKIPEKQIAIATGQQRDLDGVNLFAEDCPIRFIITKQALKEGWDCSFAYVFCSVANISSSKDVEQLLGRVLRMPNVERKQIEALNLAYAYVSSDNFFQTAHNLRDSLIESGFDAKEARELVEVSDQQLGLGEPWFGRLNRTFDELPDDKKIPKAIREKIDIDRKNKIVTFNKQFNEEEKETFKSLFTGENDKERVEDAYSVLNNIPETRKSPQKLGLKLELPQLVFDFEGDIVLFDDEQLILPKWNLGLCNAELTESEFPVKVDAGQEGTIDLDSKGNPVIKDIKDIQLVLFNMVLSRKMDRKSLIAWLMKQCSNPVVTSSQSLVYINKVIDSLLEKRKLKIEHLVFKRTLLRTALIEKIKYHIKVAKKKGYQSFLEFDDANKKYKSNLQLGLPFQFPKEYPANQLYSGPLIFSKHYYEVVGHMNNEEAECAFLIDTNSNVEYWVRNLEQKENSSFWLQTSSDKFYPDFVVKLKNGNIIVIEYKGADRYTDEDSKEKRLIGNYYSSIGDNKFKFIMLKGKDWNTLKEFLI